MINKPCFAYNIWDIKLLEIFVKLNSKYSNPSILQISEKVAEKLDIKIFSKQINLFKENWPGYVFLNLDHAKNIPFIKKCINLEWDMVTYDGSNLPLDENIKNTKEIVNYAHKHNTLVEGEINPFYRLKGFEERNIPIKTNLIKAKRFIDTTGVDYFAIALGTFHGYSPDNSVKIDYNLLKKASNELDVNLVLHGGSGLSIDTYKHCFSLNIRKINISTEIKQIYKQVIVDAIRQEDFDIRFVDNLLFESIEEFYLDKVQVLEGIE